MCDCEDDADRAAREDAESYEDSFCYIIVGHTGNKYEYPDYWISSVYKGLYNEEVAKQKVTFLNDSIRKFEKENKDKDPFKDNLQFFIKHELDLSVPDFIGDLGVWYKLESRIFDYEL